MIKLIISDVDGTLLRRNETDISEEAVRIIHNLAEKNIKFAAASGRSYHELKRLFARTEEVMYFISSDGALCTYREQTLYQKRILPEIMYRFGMLFSFEKNLSAVMSGKYMSYITGGDKQTQNKIKKDLHNHAVAVETFSEIDEEIYKISVFGTPETYFGEKLLSGDSFGLKRVYRSNEWTEFVALKADKGEAVNFLMKKSGISQSETAAIGDGENDLCMFETAGYSFVMKNGAAENKVRGAHCIDSAVDLLNKLCAEGDYIEKV